MNILSIKIKFALTLMLACSMSAFAQSEVVWNKYFGGSSSDNFYHVTPLPDGMVAVGISSPGSFGNGDWTGVTGKGGDDAIIVKFDHNGNVVWKKNFGGSGTDIFNCATPVPDGIVAVGYSDRYSFGSGDWADVERKGSDNNAIIVKYDHSGELVWAKNFGGNIDAYFLSVMSVSDGIIAVGSLTFTSSGNNGDFEDVTGLSTDAIIVKYDHNGNVVWKKRFGGSGFDVYYSVTSVPDGMVAVGYSDGISFGSGDWTGVTGNGSREAIIVKYDHNGEVVWKKNFGGSEDDEYYSVTSVPDGIIAAGSSSSASFGNIVKHDHSGNVVWIKNFGGYNIFRSVTAVSDGVAAVGSSWSGSFGNGDWTDVAGKGGDDAIIVKFANNGDVVWKKNFGGSGNDEFNAVMAVSDGIIAAGFSRTSGGGEGGGGDDAILVKYGTSGGTEPEPEPEPTHIPFFDVVIMRWNNSLTVINNPANNGGYTFEAYWWYRNGQPAGTDQSWTAGAEGEEINPADRFYVVLRTADNRALRTTETTIPLIRSAQLKAYPNPVTIGQTLHFEIDDDTLRDAVVEIYTMSGRPVETRRATSLREIRIDGKYAAGTYILVVNGRNGIRHEVKFVIEN